LNTRLLGAAVIVALAILFVPMFIPSKSPSTSTSDQSVSLTIPPAPDSNLQTKTMSLSGQPASAASSVAPATTVAPNANGLATVNIASSRPPNPATAATPAIPTPVQPVQPTPQPAQPAIPTPQPAANVASNTPAIAPQPAPPALPPATAARGIYAVNLSAYAPEGANRLMQRVRALGYPVHGEPIQRAGKSLTLVSAGPFETRAAAEAARLKISQSIPGAPARLEAGATTPQGDVPAIAGPARAGAWAVQVAAMGSQADALALRDKLRANGFDGFVDSVNAGGKQLWRVRAGPQTQRSDAVSLRDQIKAKLGLDGNVVSAN
jgi:DedD protein